MKGMESCRICIFFCLPNSRGNHTVGYGKGHQALQIVGISADGIIPLCGIWMRGLRLAQCNKRLRKELVA